MAAGSAGPGQLPSAAAPPGGAQALPAAAVPEAVTALSPFRSQIFRRVWLASTLSNFGGLIQSVGASWMMLTLAESADMVALVQASVALPLVLLSLPAGAMADNVDRRKVMLGAQVFMLLVSVALAACTWAGWITPWLLLLFTFLIGCGAAFNAPAWQASVRDMVPRAQLPGAVTLNSMGFNLARSTGPAIGGAIVAAAGAAAAFAFNAVSYVALILVLARWRPPEHPRVLPPESLGSAMAAGVRYVLLSPTIRTVLLRSVLFGFGASAVMALLPLVASGPLLGGPLTYGLLLGAFGLGAVAAAVAIARLRARLSTEAIVRGATLGFAVAAAVVGTSTSVLLTMSALLVAGAGWVLALSTFNVAVQLSAPRWVVARALALYQMAAFGGMAAGAWVWGNTADQQGTGLALLLAAGAMLLAAALGLVLPLAQSADRNLDPLRQWKEPDTVVPVQPRTGPVVVSIEYVIDEEDIVPFLAAMSERRRIRRRDGAHKWTLMRDLSDPRRWTERYKTATWLDYLRHISRLTHDDAVVPERLRALHRGDGPPRVRREIERQTSALPAAQPVSPRELSEPVTDPSRAS